MSDSGLHLGCRSDAVSFMFAEHAMAMSNAPVGLLAA